MAVTLQASIEEARRGCSDDEWLMMSPAEQTQLIYAEMRRLDREAATSPDQPVAAAQPDAPPARDRVAAAPGKQGKIRCQAVVRARQSGHCAWKATSVIDGVPYCGFHARLELAARTRARESEAVD
jgi:hypothetical protein